MGEWGPWQYALCPASDAWTDHGWESSQAWQSLQEDLAPDHLVNSSLRGDALAFVATDDNFVTDSCPNALAAEHAVSARPLDGANGSELLLDQRIAGTIEAEQNFKREAHESWNAVADFLDLCRCAESVRTVAKEAE